MELEEVAEWVGKEGFKKILIQSPEGLRSKAAVVESYLRSMGYDVMVHGGSCWGGCDVAYMDASIVGADAIIHLGHSRYLERDEIPTYYLECRYVDPAPLKSLLKEIGSKLDGYEKIGVGVTVQWLNLLDDFLTDLKKMGFKPLVGEPLGVLRYRGQILGCAYGSLLKLSDRVDCYLILGSIFHGLGLGLQIRKPVYAADPEGLRVMDMEEKVGDLLRSRYGYIEQFRRAERIGVILSIKPGQRRIRLAIKLRDVLEDSGRKPSILVMNDIREDYLMSLPHEAFVNTACPRLSIEDQAKIRKPLLLPSETLIALGKIGWEDLIRTPRYLSMEVP